MSTDVADDDFFAEFAEDYFAECEEHLTVIRRDLLEMEAFVHQPQVERSLLEELFGTFHSFKGMSGMIGVKEAEQLAHEMESYLRVLREKQVVLSQGGMDALIAGTKMLEKVIDNRRTQEPAPDIEPAIAQLQAIVPDAAQPAPDKTEDASTQIFHPLIPSASREMTEEQLFIQEGTGEDVDKNLLPDGSSTLPAAPVTLKPEEKAHLADALQKGKKIWRFEFAPIPQRGINVKEIRDRLQANGEIIHAEPRITTEGGVVFDFLLASDAQESIFADWRDDGVTYTLYQEGERGRGGESEQEARGQGAGSKGELPSTSLQPNEEARGQGAGSRGELPSTSLQLNEVGQEENPPSPCSPSPCSPASYPPPPVIAATAPSNVVRVDLAKLDELMRIVGELVISRARLDDNLTKLETVVPARQLRSLRETNLNIERQLRDLRDGVMRVRLVPINEIFARMQFLVRDIARESNKKVRLELSGQETEIDKFIVERMMDPLLHLVRNAVSHGLESESDRLRLGKPPYCVIALRAAYSGELVVIEIEDDGRGVDVQAVAARARGLGLIDDDVAIDIRTALDIICSPGFSTREQADLTSGRGVGMAVVKNTVHELGGLLTLESKVGEGTRFTIQLPLTLAIADALIVSAGEQIFAVPQSSVREVIQVQRTAVTVLQNNEMIGYRGGALPLIRLSRLFGLAESSEGRFFAFVVGSGLNAAAIAVDRILGFREIVIRTLRDPLVQVMGIAGATELGDGRVVLILDVVALTNLKSKS